MNPANYYLPEESLNKVAEPGCAGGLEIGSPGQPRGRDESAVRCCWSWELSLILANKVPAALPLAARDHPKQCRAAGQSVFRKLIVERACPGPVMPRISFRSRVAEARCCSTQYALPGTNASDVNFFGNVGVGTYTRVLSNALPGAPLLLPGQRYYLRPASTNPSPTVPLNYTLTVDFDIYTLTNAVAVTNNAILVRECSTVLPIRRVDTNAQVTTFQILNPTGNAEMVVSKGTLPDTANYNYLNVGSNSVHDKLCPRIPVPVPLSAGRWYIGVFNDDVNTINYTIVATEAGPPTIISLTNGVPFNFKIRSPDRRSRISSCSASPTACPRRCSSLYNLSGNVDLTLDRNAFPH